MGKFFPYLLKNGCVGPDMLQNVYTCMPENKVRNCLADAAKGIGAVSQHAQNSQNSTDAAAMSILAKYLP
jgi:hypothetical protein